MNFLTMRLIILLLTLLQGFAPLVHAHVQRDNGQAGIHLEGFAYTNYENSQTLSKSSECEAYLVIGLGSAIQQKYLLVGDSATDEPQLYPIPADIIKLPVFIEKQVGFSPPVRIDYFQVFSLCSAPRAPPVIVLSVYYLKRLMSYDN